MRHFLITTLFIFLHYWCFSQTAFSTTIVIPNHILLEEITITKNIGYEEIEIESPTRTFTITDTSVTKYGVITVYDRKNHYLQRFFVNARVSSITFIAGLLESFVKDFKLVNAFSSQQLGEDKLYEYAKKEIDASDAFVRQYVDFSIQNDSINKRSSLLEEKSRKKQFEFIKNNNKLYYSLWLFKFNYVDSKYYDTEKLYKLFNKKIKKNFKGYTEVAQIEEILSGRRNVLLGKMAPQFTSKDIDGKTITSEALKGQYVLINFWAPWCGPCVKEMPDIAEINKIYGANKIKVISVNCDQDYESFSKAIKKYEMNWTNIHYDLNMINRFGKIRSIPQVFLIDKSGKVIYSRVENKDFNLKKLLNKVENLE